MKKLNYEEDIKIDESALDIEWLEQAPTAINYGVYWAKKKRQVELLEEEIKVLRSELTKKARKDPEKYFGKGKSATDALVEAFYRSHEDHVALKQELIQAQFELDVAFVAYTQMGNTRKTALENLVKLHGQNYFAGPKVPRDITSERRNRESSRKQFNSKVFKRKRTN